MDTRPGNSQPKPTTGEWTVEKERTSNGWYVCANNEPAIDWPFTEREAKAIADAHNSALAVRQQHIDNLDKALAAERERATNEERLRWQQVHHDFTESLEERQRLREQLAAAQAAMRDILALDTDVPSLFQAKQICLKALKGDTTALDAAKKQAYEQGRKDERDSVNAK